MTESKFDLYTYQLTPIKKPQYDLFDDHDEQFIIANKNRILNDIVLNGFPIFNRNSQLRHKIEYQEDDFILLRLANKKNISIEKEFHRTTMESEPSCIIAFYNNPAQQVMAVESDKTSFGSSKTVINLLKKALTRALEKESLRITIQPQYEEEAFWKLVKKYDSKISKIQFQFDLPNLSRVNQYLYSELKDISKGLGSLRTTLQFDAGYTNTLFGVDEDNTTLNLLIKASAKGSGPIKIMPLGSRRYETTAINNLSIFFHELSFDSLDNEKMSYAKELKNRIEIKLESLS